MEVGRLEHLNDLTKWVNEQVGKDVQTTYEQYRKIKEFEDVGYFLLPYVVSGGVVTQDILRNDEILVTDIVVSLSDDVMYRRGNDFRVRDENAIYYLDFTSEGDWHFETSHTEGIELVDYLTIAEVTTDANGVITSIIDKRGTVGGFRLKDEFGLEDYAKKVDLDNVKKRMDQPLVGLMKTIQEDNMYNCWPVLVKTTEGRLIAFYASGPQHLAIDNGAVPGRRLNYRYSDNDGLLWSDEITMLYDPNIDHTTFSAIAPSNGNVIVIATETTVVDGVTTNVDYVVMESIDNGITFTPGFRFKSSADIVINRAGYPNVPVEMEGGRLVAAKNFRFNGFIGLGFIFSSDYGKTWTESVTVVPADTYTSYDQLPWEVRMAYLGNGRLLALGRNNVGNLYQLTSSNSGQSWTTTFSNINGARNDCVFPIYFADDGTITVYYNDRLASGFKKRTSNALSVFNNSKSWNESEVISYTSSRSTGPDAGYTTTIRLYPDRKETLSVMYTTRDKTSALSDNKDTAIVAIYDTVQLKPSIKPENLLINGDMRVWDYGDVVSGVAAGRYVANRWFSRRTTSSLGYTIRKIVGDRGSSFRLQRDAGNTLTNTIWTGQIIETLDTLQMRNKVLTISLEGKCGPNYSPAGRMFNVTVSTGTTVDGSFTDTAGAIAGSVDLIDRSFTLTEEYALFSETSTIPVPFDANIIRVRVRTNTPVGTAGADDWLEFTNVQLTEVGNKFKSRPVSEEISMCERYLTKFNAGTIGNGYSTTATQARIQVTLTSTMRILPSLVATAADWKLTDGTTDHTISAMSIIAAQSNNKVITLLCTTTGLTPFRPYQLMSVDATKSLSFNAEL